MVETSGLKGGFNSCRLSMLIGGRKKSILLREIYVWYTRHIIHPYRTDITVHWSHTWSESSDVFSHNTTPTLIWMLMPTNAQQQSASYRFHLRHMKRRAIISSWFMTAFKSAMGMGVEQTTNNTKRWNRNCLVQRGYLWILALFPPPPYCNASRHVTERKE